MPGVAPRSVHDHSLPSMTTFLFDHVQDFQVQITDEFLDFCMGETFHRLSFMISVSIYDVCAFAFWIGA